MRRAEAYGGVDPDAVLWGRIERSIAEHSHLPDRSWMTFSADGYDAGVVAFPGTCRAVTKAFSPRARRCRSRL